MNELEEGNKLQLDYEKLNKIASTNQDVLPVAVQHAETQEVILLAFVNRQALEASIRKKSAIFWSTSRNELWEKGLTSGETFELKEVRVNCEQNSLVYKVLPRKRNICHTKNKAGEPRNCFYRVLDMETGELVNTDP